MGDPWVAAQAATETTLAAVITIGVLGAFIAFFVFVLVPACERLARMKTMHAVALLLGGVLVFMWMVVFTATFTFGAAR